MRRLLRVIGRRKERAPKIKFESGTKRILFIKVVEHLRVKHLRSVVRVFEVAQRRIQSVRFQDCDFSMLAINVTGSRLNNCQKEERKKQQQQNS